MQPIRRFGDGLTAGRDRLALLRREVDQIGPMVERVVQLPATGHGYAIVLPAEIDPLLDRVAHDPEQNLPYWAELWPSGIALADAIEQSPTVLHQRRVIELGCGLGVTAAAALRAGAALTVTDYAPEALALCRLNAYANAWSVPETVAMNWRNPTASERCGLRGRFDIVLAADVLYERRDISPIIALVHRLLAPGGWIWLAEPGRPVAAEFMAQTGRLGWTWQTVQHHGPWPDPADAGVVVGVHQTRPLV